MADSPAFAWTCQEIEKATALDRLESRGTVRIALKNAGLEAASVTPSQMQIVIDKVLPPELESRGFEGADELCARLSAGVIAVEASTSAEAPDEVFRRLGGS